MCTLHKREPVGIKVFTGIHLNKCAIFVDTNDKECRTDAEYSWFSVFICYELARLGLLTQGCTGPGGFPYFHILIKTFWRNEEVLDRCL